METYRDHLNSTFSDEIWGESPGYVLADLPARQLSLDDTETRSLRKNSISKSSSTTWDPLGETYTQIEQTETDYPREAQAGSPRTKTLSGHVWQAVAASVILLLNFVLLFVVAFGLREKGPDGYPAIETSSCDGASRLSQGIHYVINILATILLAASNYYMQRLSSCTRSEIDRAHQRGSWADVGVSSVRNMRFMSWDRIVLWWILVLSSLPIHLLYNSVAFETSGGNLYTTAVVSSSFIASGNRQFVEPDSGDQVDFTNFKNISNSDCIKQYSAAQVEFSGASYLTSGGSVVAVSSDENIPSDVIFAFGSSSQNILWASNFTTSTQNFTSVFNDTNMIEAYNADTQQDITLGLLWVCRDSLDLDTFGVAEIAGCNLKSLESGILPWTINGFPISYCLADEQPMRCSVQFSTTILIVVVVSNLLKVTCMLATIFRIQHRPLITIGDAIASFVASKDDTTSGRCLLSKKDVQSGSYIRLEGTNESNRWKRQRNRWFRSVSWKRWSFLTILVSLTLGVSIYLLALGVYNNTSQSYNTGLNQFGAGNSVSIGQVVSISDEQSPSVIKIVLIANAPQLLVSIAYFQLNAIMTAMLANAEWASFAFKRKPLRLSSPRGQQRSTYWLQLPYRYSIPLLAVMITLHWAISQSIFLVRMALFQDGEQLPDYGFTQLGWTSGALMLSIILGGVLYFTCVSMGVFMRYSPGLPLLGGCSLVISAACHAQPDDKNAELGPVQWGVVGVNEDGTSHCGFGSKDVRLPYEGEICT
ncbi:uncharacterized protein LY89DRAFT_655765 [Mollisia scopiformis]|uniref:DUF6536 domain-containing protein n=1 Tax=Mollisia scopiformis TaxID=149040 RepID=A0A194WSI4_MOLSC|nr:uncharacterized protein LY89DRAFT_655765 [Mollisia scopiformis]KUJ10921.1 hypothetical protein LY89DRAFT_655765 [Mollisia scopiformis]